MKWFFRIIILNFFVGGVVAYFQPVMINPLVDIIGFREALLIIWIAGSTVGSFFWLAYMFYHWGTSEFKNRTIKRAWFFALLFGMILYFLGPLVYYIDVYEMKKGLKE